jgi:hypothetical protein
MGTRTRLLITLGLGLFLGAWTLIAQESTPSDLVAMGALLVLLIAAAVVRRWFAVLAVLGPLVALGILELSGYVGPQEEYANLPLLSPPGIAVLVELAFLLMLGMSLGQGIDWLRDAWEDRRKRRAQDESLRPG